MVTTDAVPIRWLYLPFWPFSFAKSSLCFPIRDTDKKERRFQRVKAENLLRPLVEVPHLISSADCWMPKAKEKKKVQAERRLTPFLTTDSKRSQFLLRFHISTNNDVAVIVPKDNKHEKPLNYSNVDMCLSCNVRSLISWKKQNKNNNLRTNHLRLFVTLPYNPCKESLY